MRVRPSGAKPSPPTGPRWPSRLASSAPPATSQTSTSPNWPGAPPAEISVLPSGAKGRASTRPPRGQRLAVRREADAGDGRVLDLQLLDLLAGAHVPQARGAVGAGGRQRL